MHIISSDRRKAIRRAVVSGAAAVAVVFGATACTQPADDNTGGDEKKFTIGVAEANTTISFLATLDNAIKEEAAKNNVDVIILNGEFDNAKQAANVETLVAKKVDVIIVISSSPTSVLPAIEKAEAAGIPVIAVNAKLDDAAKIVTYVGASDYDFGVSQGELLIEALPDGGKVAVILGKIGDTPQVLRLEGLQDALKDHPEIEIVATPTDSFDSAENLAVTQDLLTKYPKGELDAIVAQGPQRYVGAEWALENGRDDVKFIAGDYPTQVADAIKSGALFGTVNQSPILEGQLGAQYAWLILNGKIDEVPQPEFLIDIPLITKDNVDSSPAEWTY